MVILVLNIGLKNARCIAFNEDGKLLAQAVKPVHTFVSNERVEQNPSEWLEHAEVVISSVVKALGSKASDVKYLTVTTSASCLVMVDKNLMPLGRSLLVSDTRSVGEVKQLDRLAEFQTLKSQGFKASADLMIPKLMWLKQNEKEHFEQARYFLNIGDFITAKLTGRVVTDPNNALKFYYSISEKSYPKQLLRSLGINIEALPEVLELGQDIDRLSNDMCLKFSLGQNVRVIMSTYDALAAVAGNGAFGVGDAVDISGTVTSFRLVTDQKVYDSKNRFYVSPHTNKNLWLAGGSTNLGGGIIEWLRALNYSDFENAYDQMEVDANQCPPCPGGLIFLPHLLGERTPIWNSDCRGVFFGLNRAHQRKEIARAVFEGCAFSVQHIASVLKEFDMPIKEVTVAGGLSQIKLVNQIKSDVLGVPVKQFKNFETTAIGAAMIALVGVGIFSSTEEAFKQFCHLDYVYEPNASNHEIYSEYFELYKSVYESLKDCYKERAQILSRLHQRKGINELIMTENL